MIVRDRLSKRISKQFDLLGEDTRGVSIAIDYALGFLILLTLSGVFIAGVADIQDSREEAVIDQELDRIADEVAAGVLTVDSLNDHRTTYNDRTEQGVSGEDGDVRTRISLPPTIGGSGYTVTVGETEGSTSTITVASNGESVEKEITLESDIEDATATGSNNIVIEGNPEEGTISMEGR